MYKHNLNSKLLNVVSKPIILNGRFKMRKITFKLIVVTENIISCLKFLCSAMFLITLFLDSNIANINKLLNMNISRNGNPTKLMKSYNAI